MKKLQCVICAKYRKFKNPKISYIFEKQFFLLFAVSAKIKMKKYLQKKIQLRYQKFLVYLEIYNYLKNLVEENISQEFRLKNIDKTRNYFLEEIKENELMSGKHKKVCDTLNYVEFSLFLSFYNYWICFHLCFCFFSRYSYRNCEFCNRIKSLCNSSRN